jgi:Ca-activated chloride channel family protein
LVSTLLLGLVACSPPANAPVRPVVKEPAVAVACDPSKPPPAVATTPAVVSTTAASAVEISRAPRIEVATATTPTLARAEKETDVTVRVRVRGLPLAQTKRTPLDLALVVDTSGSMDGVAIEKAREAVGRLVDLLAEGDTVSIVTFGSHANVVVPATKIDKETRPGAKAAIARIKAEGTTDMAGGLATGLAQLRGSCAPPNAIHRLVLVGDGVPNDSAPVLALADQAKASHIPITTLGLGNDFDETLMAAVAQRSSATFHFVEDGAGVAAVFEHEITRMERVVARGTQLEIVGGPGVTIKEIVGFALAPGARVAHLPLGDLAEGQVRDIFVRATVKGTKDGRNAELLDANVSYSAPELGAMTATSFAKMPMSADEGRLKDASVREIEHGSTTVRVADGIVKAVALARAGDLAGARKVLDAAQKLAKEGETKFGDKALGEKVVEMTKLRKTLPSLLPQVDDTRHGSMGGGMGRPAPPRPVAASPAEAMSLRASHGDAMKQLQGL